MATKKSAKKSGGKKTAKKSTKKAVKKTAAVGVSSGTLACIRRCHDQFITCLQKTHNFKKCATDYQVCIRRCLNF